MNLALATDMRVVAGNARLMSGFLRIGLHPGGELLRGVELAVRGRGGMNDERLRIADVREVRQDFHGLDEAHARRGAATHAKGKDSARAVGQVLVVSASCSRAMSE